jgi:hypothetical protein
MAKGKGCLGQEHRVGPKTMVVHALHGVTRAHTPGCDPPTHQPTHLEGSQHHEGAGGGGVQVGAHVVLQLVVGDDVGVARDAHLPGVGGWVGGWGVGWVGGWVGGWVQDVGRGSV